mgnify:FL=1
MDPKRYLPLIGQRVELRVRDLEGDPDKSQEVYITKVEDISTGSITVASPIKDGEVVPLRAGVGLTVTYVRDQGLFAFDTAVVERLPGQVPQLKLDLPDEIVRVQRRNYKRVSARFPVNYSSAEADSLDGTRDSASFRCAECVDISAGGIRIRLIDVVAGIKLGAYVRLSFALPAEDKRSFDVVGQVMRIERLDSNSRLGSPSSEANLDRAPVIEEIKDPAGTYRLALRFVGISQREQDWIMKFVFDRERELIGRGLISR